jgi:hypothetical protein
MNPNDKDQTPSKGGVLKSLFTGVIYIFAFLAAIVVKPAQALKREAYDKSSGFAFAIGIIASIVGSIGVGYSGFQHGVPLQWWLGSAIVAPFAIYYYLWPIAYLGLRSWAFKFSEFLWKRVPNCDDSRADGPKWFSYFLSGVTQLIIVAAGIYTLCTVASHIHDYLGWNNIWAWGVGVVGGGFLAFAGGMLVSTALWQIGMPSVALLSGIGLTYFFGIDLSAHLPSFVEPFASSYSTAIRHGGEALQVILFVAYVFPLVHIVISRMFGWMGKYYNRLLDKTYSDNDKNYLGFLCQALNIAVAGTAAVHAFGYSSNFGYGYWLSVPATAVAALAAYLIGGGLLSRWSNRVVGVLSSLAVGYFAFTQSFVAVPFGAFGAIVAGVVAAVATAFLIYPLVYQVVKLIANPLLASWLGKPLAEFYTTISSEVFSSIEKTYNDNTAYGPLFVHLVNIGTAIGVYLLVSDLVPMIHLSGWTALTLPSLLAVSSYLFVGRLLVAYKTALIGTITSIGAGAFVGVEVFAHLQHNWWYAVPSFIAGALVFGFAIFPVSYVVLRAGLEAVAASRWARPAVEGVYNFFFSFVQKGWNEFMVIYRRISLSFAPVWANVSKTWDEAWETAKKTFNDAFNGKDKK